jgi:hypothetical protein
MTDYSAAIAAHLLLTRRIAATTKYTGPVPTVTHVHGMENVQDNSDGYTEAWFLPNATNLEGHQPVS